MIAEIICTKHKDCPMKTHEKEVKSIRARIYLYNNIYMPKD